MTDKELKQLKRLDLLELILKQDQELETLQKKLQEAEARLSDVQVLRDTQTEQTDRIAARLDEAESRLIESSEMALHTSEYKLTALLRQLKETVQQYIDNDETVKKQDDADSPAWFSAGLEQVESMMAQHGRTISESGEQNVSVISKRLESTELFLSRQELTIAQANESMMKQILQRLDRIEAKLERDLPEPNTQPEPVHTIPPEKTPVQPSPQRKRSSLLDRLGKGGTRRTNFYEDH